MTNDKIKKKKKICQGCGMPFQACECNKQEQKAPEDIKEDLDME